MGEKIWVQLSLVEGAVKALLARAAYRVSRAPLNRVNDIDHCMRELAKHGYRPRVTIAPVCIKMRLNTILRVAPGSLTR